MHENDKRRFCGILFSRLLAHSVEHSSDKRKVLGSIPRQPTSGVRLMAGFQPSKLIMPVRIRHAAPNFIVR